MIELLLIVIALLLVLACGIFVAAEFSLLAVNRNSVDALAKKGDKRARNVAHSLRTLSTQLSSAQVGITVTNLGIGFLAEPAIAALISPWLLGVGMAEPAVPAVALAIGLVIATIVTMLLGELVPKNLAIAKPYATAARVQWPLLFFTGVMRGPINWMNGSANWVLHRFGVEPTEELASARSGDELLALVRRSAEQGTLPRETAAMLERSMSFGDLAAIDVMTPRLRVDALGLSATAEDVLNLAQKTGHSRFPVHGSEGLDDVKGVVHIKHAFVIAKAKRARTSVASIMSQPLLLPSSISLEALLDDLRDGGLQMAVLLDEYGAVDGVVTIEDLMEELVGDLQDEYDNDVADVLKTAEGVWDVSGLVRADELAEATDFYLPEHDDVETLGGLVAHMLERIPDIGDSVVVAGVDREGKARRGRLSVMGKDGHRVDRLHVELLEPLEPGDVEAAE